MNNLITPLDITDKPTDPYRIIPILEELRKVWGKEPKRTLGEVLVRVIDKEFELDYISEITDDEFLAALQNYSPNKSKEKKQTCGMIMIGSGTDTYDSICELPEGHHGLCRSTSAIDQHKINEDELEEKYGVDRMTAEDNN